MTLFCKIYFRILFILFQLYKYLKISRYEQKKKGLFVIWIITFYFENKLNSLKLNKILMFSLKFDRTVNYMVT